MKSFGKSWQAYAASLLTLFSLNCSTYRSSTESSLPPKKDIRISYGGILKDKFPSSIDLNLIDANYFDITENPDFNCNVFYKISKVNYSFDLLVYDRYKIIKEWGNVIHYGKKGTSSYGLSWIEYELKYTDYEKLDDSTLSADNLTIKSRSPNRNFSVKISSSKTVNTTLKTDNNGRISIPIKLESSLVLTKIRRGNKFYASSAYDYLGDFLGDGSLEPYDKITISVDNKTPRQLKGPKGKKFDYKENNFNPFITSEFKVEESFEIYVGSKEKLMRLIDENRRKTIASQNSQDERDRLEGIINSAITQNLGILSIEVRNAATGNEIKGAEVSITSDAKDPYESLKKAGFPEYKIKDYKIPNYPHSWNGNHWGNGAFQRYSAKINFVVFKGAEHKVVIRVPGNQYLEFADEFTPEGNKNEYIAPVKEKGITLDIYRSFANTIGGGSLIKK